VNVSAGEMISESCGYRRRSQHTVQEDGPALAKANKQKSFRQK
jgi:hypothetical protein